MIKIKNIIIILLILSVILSVNIVSANELNTTDISMASDLNQQPYPEDISSEYGSYLSSGNSDEIMSSSNEDDISEDYVIYVGMNNENGNGSLENPFVSLELACNNISSGKNNVTINVLDGTYYIGADLTFNCSNLHIKGLGDNVVFANKYPKKQHDGKINSQESLDLIDNQGNFTLSNILIDTSTKSYVNNMYRGQYFLICKGTPKIVTFDNCTFLNYCEPITTEEEYRNRTYLFNKCVFKVTNEGSKSVTNSMTGIIVNNATLKNCIFYWERPKGFTGQPVSLHPENIAPLFEDCWLGINSIPDNFYGPLGEDMGYIINRYAIFSISENYLGNNTYEVTGKLVWNDSTTDGFENFNPMVVSLSSSTGNISNTAILENGTFKVIYISDEPNHEIIATLDNEIQTIQFQSINITLDTPTIAYGDNQNITVTLPEEYNGVVYLTVNNKTYKKDVEFTKVVTVDILDILPVGTHDVAVIFVDKIDNETCAIYGFNKTNIIVNKAIPNVNISYDGDLTPGEKLSIKVEMPYATENVTIIVNGDKNTTKLVDNIATYTIDKLVVGTYYVTVLYAGDVSLDFAYKTDSFDVVKSTSDLIKELNENITAKDAVIDELNANVTAKDAEITALNNNLTEKDNIIADKDVEITTLNDSVKTLNSTVESQAKEISDLNATVVAQNKTIEKSLNPVATSISVGNISTTATTAKNFTILLVDANNIPLVNKTVMFTVNGKTDSVITNGSGVAVVKVVYSTAGTRYYIFSFLGENGFSASIASAKVVVSKKATKLTAPKKAFKVKTKTKKVQIKLTTGKTVLKNKKVTLKVKGKTYTAKTNKKGIATFKITKLTKKGTFKYTVKFSGDKAYKAVNKNGKIIIK